MIKSNNATNTAIYNKCRVCLQQGYKQIFSENNSGISQHLSVFGDIEITEDDNYPKCLCKHCLNFLHIAIKFRETAKKTQLLLMKLEQNSYKNLSEIYAQKNEISQALEALDYTYLDSDEETIFESFIGEDAWNDFDEHHQLSVKSASSYEDVNQSSQKDINESQINQTELQFLSKSLPHTNESKCLSKNEEIKSSSSLGRQSSVGLIHQTVKDEENKISTTLDVNQDSQCTNKNINQSHRKEVKLKASRRLTKSKQYIKETTMPSCGEEDIKNLKASEVTAHCDKYFKIIQVGNVLKYQCNICKKALLSKRSRALHLHLVHLPLSEYSFICEVCGRQFVRKADLQIHSNTHSVDPEFKCDMCPYRGYTQALLKCHKRVHSDQFRYSCALCPQKFKSNGNLHVHLRKHGKPMFKCETCPKSFYEKASLKKHTDSQHLGIKK